MLSIDMNTLVLISGTLIPVLVALVAKKVTSSGFKGVLNAVLSTVAAVVAVLMDGEGSASISAVAHLSIGTFVTSIAAYYGIWKPTNVTQTVQDKTADFGLGRQTPDECENFLSYVEDGIHDTAETS